MYFLGLDGGGTKTTALVTDGYFNEIFKMTGKSINYYSEGLSSARENMQEMIDIIAYETGIMHFNSVFIGMSALFGAASPEEIRAFADKIIPADRIGMNSDLFIALKACAEPNAAICISGTGSMAAGLKADGSVITKGGFGYILGDEGSAYAIAIDAIKEAVRSAEGIGEETQLTQALIDFYSVKSVYELVDVFYKPPITRKAIAAFAVRVTELARKGDISAAFVLKRQAELFAKTARALLREMPESTSLFRYGGVFQHDEIFTGFFNNAISPFCEKCEPLLSEPVWGAIIAAGELL